MAKITRKSGGQEQPVKASSGTRITRKTKSASKRVTANTARTPGAWLVFEDKNGVLKKLWYSREDYKAVRLNNDFDQLNPGCKFKYWEYEDGWTDPSVEASRRSSRKNSIFADYKTKKAFEKNLDIAIGIFEKQQGFSSVYIDEITDDPGLPGTFYVKLYIDDLAKYHFIYDLQETDSVDEILDKMFAIDPPTTSMAEDYANRNLGASKRVTKRQSSIVEGSTSEYLGMDGKLVVFFKDTVGGRIYTYGKFISDDSNSVVVNNGRDKFAVPHSNVIGYANSEDEASELSHQASEEFNNVEGTTTATSTSNIAASVSQLALDIEDYANQNSEFTDKFWDTIVKYYGQQATSMSQDWVLEQLSGPPNTKMMREIKSLYNSYSRGVQSSTEVTATYDDSHYIDSLAEKTAEILLRGGHGVSFATSDTEIIITFEDTGYKYTIPVSDIVPNWDDLGADAAELADYAADEYEIAYEDMEAYNQLSYGEDEVNDPAGYYDYIDSSTTITAAIPTVVLELLVQMVVPVVMDEIDKFIQQDPDSNIQAVINHIIDFVKNLSVVKDNAVLNEFVESGEDTLKGWVEETVNEAVEEIATGEA